MKDNNNKTKEEQGVRLQHSVAVAFKGKYTLFNKRHIFGLVQIESMCRRQNKN